MMSTKCCIELEEDEPVRIFSIVVVLYPVPLDSNNNIVLDAALAT